MQSYSQYNQDVILYNNFFKDIDHGYYVDIGSHDGVSLSNTKFYEDRGWNGICIEPQPDAYEKLIANRKCRTLRGAVSDLKVNTVEFCKITGYSSMLSGIIKYYDDRHKERILSEIQSHENNTKEKIVVDNYNFNNVIEETNINLLSLDTEGGEDKIINSIDFSRYKIDVILFEDNYNDSYDKLNSNVKSLYKPAKYRLGSDIVLKRID